MRIVGGKKIGLGKGKLSVCCGGDWQRTTTVVCTLRIRKVTSFIEKEAFLYLTETI